MPSATDERLRNYLDSNQVGREQMCRAILAVDKRFTDVRPRHPKGGRDGGRDIEAIFRSEQKAFGAVGFANGANDSSEQKRRIRKKFKGDLAAAYRTENKPGIFVFVTNLNFTIGEKDQLISEAKKIGADACEIIDRERLRIELDAPSGFFIRFQYLSIPLSEAEQASFLSQYGDEIQSVISTGFQRVEERLNRLLFLQEASQVLDSLVVRVQLDREYDADEIGHFRLYCSLFLREPKLDILQILFGSCDEPERVRSPAVFPNVARSPGIKNGIAGSQWEGRIDLNSPQSDDASKGLEFEPAGLSYGAGQRKVRDVVLIYRHDDALVRLQPRLSLYDLNDCMFILRANRTLAKKIKSFHLMANGYHLGEVRGGDISIDETSSKFDVPLTFTPEELSDPWVRLRPSQESAFHIRFSNLTPKRLYKSPEVK